MQFISGSGWWQKVKYSPMDESFITNSTISRQTLMDRHLCQFKENMQVSIHIPANNISHLATWLQSCLHPDWFQVWLSMLSLHFSKDITNIGNSFHVLHVYLNIRRSILKSQHFLFKPSMTLQRTFKQELTGFSWSNFYINYQIDLHLVPTFSLHHL